MPEPQAAAPAVSPQLSLEDYERLQPAAKVRAPNGVEVVYHTPNRMTRWRVETLMSKEPDTIDWIAGFAPGDVLVDIGANVGMYTIWAAKTRAARVFAFEPESQNYALLNRNIQANRLSDLVVAYACALSDETRFGELHLSDATVGGSCHSFEDAVDFHLKPAAFPFKQGSFSTTLDRVIADGVVPVPHHIKLDVDGLEHKVLAGAAATLENPDVQSVLVEVNTHLPEHQAIIERMADLGFGYSDAQIDVAIRKQGAFEGIGNYVFKR